MAFITSLNLRALALAGALLLAAPVAAKTDIGGCVSSATKNQWGEASMIWYVPDTGEVCELLDCGGGRAPPKTNVPGCGNYKGTAEYQPTFLPGFGASGDATATATAKGSSSAAAATGVAESASPKPTDDDMDTTMLTGTRNPPPVTSPATTTTAAASGTTETETSASTSATAAAAGGSSDESANKSDAAESDAATATSPSAGAGAMPTAAPLGMFIGLVAGAVLF